MINSAELQHLLGFIGYGDKDADLWFLGMEEGGGGESNIRARLSFKPFEDNYEAHKKLGILKFHEGKRIIQRTWRGMSLLSLLISERPTDTESIREHQAEVLGRLGSNTLLCELMPIPKASIGTWGYEKLIPQFESRESYYAEVMPKRIPLLRDLYHNCRPKIVIAYGKGFWDSYKKIFTGAVFVKNGEFEVGCTDYGVIVLCSHFTARSMNGMLPELAEIIKNQLRQ